MLGERFAFGRAPPCVRLGEPGEDEACLPRKSDRLYVFPFDACSKKSGAASPIPSEARSSTGGAKSSFPRNHGFTVC